MRLVVRKVICLVVLITFLNLSALGQMRGPMGNLFQGQPPPPGAVTVMGRAFFGSMETGFGNSLALLISADNQDFRQELGLTDAESNAIQLLRAQMMLGAPQYANRFRTMTEENQQSVEQDLLRDMGRVTAALDNMLAPERKEKVQKLVFQSLGGLDSPLTTMSSMEALNLSEDQKKKMQTVFDEMRDERAGHMESTLKMMESAMERIAAVGGPQNLSQEEREEFDAMRRELEAKSLVTARKLADRLRQHLTPTQLELEKQLIATRPDFLGRLPRHMQREENTAAKESDVYSPGINSWQPGQPLPVPIREQPRGRFPRAEAKTEPAKPEPTPE